jgi:hypothetical protein
VFKCNLWLDFRIGREDYGSKTDLGIFNRAHVRCSMLYDEATESGCMVMCNVLASGIMYFGMKEIMGGMVQIQNFGTRMREKGNR